MSVMETIGKVRRGEETAFTDAHRRQPRPRLDPFLDRLNALLEQNADTPRRFRLTMRRILDVLRDDGIEMHCGEIILIKGYDSEKDRRVRFTPHTAFDHPHIKPSDPPRISIKVRTIAVI